jgi:hypothetical protein
VLVREGLNLAQAGEPSQRFDLDLADALPRQAKPAADLLQRLRLVVVEAVAEHDPLARLVVFPPFRDMQWGRKAARAWSRTSPTWRQGSSGNRPDGDG